MANSNNTGGGTTISFTNTPQAVDDNLGSALTGLTEDSRTVVILDVMGNDLGGNAKSLWSVDNGTNESGAMSGYVAADLLTQDAGRTEALSSDTSLNGARIWITADGKVGYDTATLSADFAGKLQALAQGQDFTDSFIYAIRLASGTLSWAKATVHFLGVNDAPVITSTPTDALGNVKEDTTLSVTGQLSAHDVDNGATQAWSVVGSATGGYGAISVDANTGKWTYALANGTNGVASAVQSLAAGQSVVDSFTIRVSDGMGGTADQIVKVTIAGTNDAPVITSDVNAASGAVKEDATLSATGQLTASDIDNGATQAWSIVGGAAGGYGSLSVDANTGKWTYALANGTDGVASAVQSLPAGQSVTDSFTVRVSDGQGGSADQVVKVTITGTNDAPVITSDVNAASGAVKEDATLSATGQLTASDIDSGATQAWSIVGGATGGYGSLSVDANTGKWTYTLANGTDGVASAVQSLAAGQTVTDTFTVRVSDGQGGSADQVVNVTIAGSNDAPVITSDATAALGSVKEDATLSATGQLAAHDIDTGATQAWSIVGTNTSAYGSLSVDANTGKWTYTLANGTDGVASAVQSLAAGQSVTDSFTVRVSDGQGGSADQIVNVTIAGSNDAPVITSDVNAASGNVQEDLNLSASGQLAASDIDSGATQAWSVVGPNAGTYGSLSVDNTGKWTYTLANGTDGVASVVQNLAAGQTVNDSFTVRVSDGQGGTADQIVKVTIAGNNDAPVITSDANAALGNVQEDTTLTATGQLAAHDVDTGATQAWSVVGPNTGTYGSLGVDNTGKWTYTLANGTNGIASAVQSLAAGQSVNDSFTVRVSDGQGGTADQIVKVTITGTNDKAVIGSDSKALTETNAPLGTSGQLAITDIDSSQTFQAQNNVAGQYGTFSLAADGTWNYAMNGAHNEFEQGKTYTDTLSVTSADGTTKANAVTVTIAGTNDAPVAVNDGGAVTASAANQVISNTVHWIDWTGVSANGDVNGTIDLGNGQSVSVVFHSTGLAFTQTDGTGTNYYTTPAAQPGDTTLGTGTYTSAAVANGPTGSDIIALNLASSPRVLTFSQPIDNLFFAVVSLNGNGYKFDQDFTIDSYGRGYWGDGYATKSSLGNGQYLLQGNGELHGVIQIAGSVNSLTWTSASNEYWNGFTIGTYGKAQTNLATGNLLTNDTDAEHNPLTVTAVNGQNIVGNSILLTLASGAKVNVNIDGSYSYDENGKFASLAQGQTFTDSFTYTVKDSLGAVSNVATASITVTGINDAPVAKDDAVTTNEDNAITVNVLGNDTDPDNGDTLSLVSSAGAQHGTLSLSGNSVIYTPAANFNGADNFTYTIKDAAGATSTATVNVTVNAVNDPPTVSLASPLAITNGSFDNGSTSGWTQLAGGVDVVANSGWQSAEGTAGTFSLDLNAFTKGGVQQTLTTVPGVTYTINFMLSKNPGSASYPDTFAKVEVAATGNTALDYTYDSANTTSNMLWQQKSYTFTATTTSTVLSFTSLTPATSQGFPIDAQGPALDKVTLAAPISTLEDTSTSIKGITVADIDAGSNAIKLDLTVAHGSLTLTSTTGLSGDLNGSDGVLSLVGSQAAINAALSGGLSYTPAANYSGSDTFTATVNDQGQSGAGGPLTATQSQSIYVAPVGETYVLSNIIQNGSFETGNTTGWTQLNSGVDVVINSGWQSADGSYSVDLNGFHPGGVKQTLSTTAGTTYSVSFMESKNPGSGATYNTIGTVQVSAASSSQNYSFTDANTTTNMMWSQQTFTFTATGSSTDLSFVSLTPSTPQSFPLDAQGPTLDNVVVVANTVFNNFARGPYGDVLQLSGLLTSIHAAHDSTAFTNGYLRFLQSGSDTLVQIDANGGGDHYMTAATLVGVNLTQADTYNYVL